MEGTFTSNAARWIAGVTVALSVLILGMPAEAQHYTLNGQLPSAAVAQYMAANLLGTGRYPQPMGNLHSGSYRTPNGYGDQGSNAWAHHDNGGFYVGRDSRVYTPTWSNC
jgi:hypothetical protein